MTKHWYKQEIMLNKCKVCYSKIDWLKPPIKVIDRTKAVTQHFLDKSSIKEKKKFFRMSVESWYSTCF